jgi:hypothetical protein
MSGEAAVGDRRVSDVRRHRPVPGVTPHVGAAERNASRLPPIDRLDHRSADPLDKMLGPCRVEAGSIRREAAVER